MPACGVSSLAEDEREQRGEGEVDEVRRLDQADGQEELTGELTLRLGLPSDPADQRVTGDAVTDAGTDRAAAEGQSAADEAARRGDGLGRVLCCHGFVSLLRGRVWVSAPRRWRSRSRGSSGTSR